MSKIEVNTVAPQCGTTLTLGESGDTVTLGAGASQSGFGREGSVNWQTSIKTATFTAASGEGYFCDTASVGAFTVNLPSSPSVGDIVAIKDYASNFATANLTIGRGGSNMNGSAADSVRSTDNESLTLVYADATKGWLAVEEGTGYIGETFMSATGGTITTSGDCKIHTFTGPGTFTVCAVSPNAANNLVSYMVVAGGAGAGGDAGGAGGAGGFRETKSPSTPYTASPLDGYSTPGNRITVTATAFPITVGGGGAGGSGNPSGTSRGTPGSNSVFSTITSAGGGGGGDRTVSPAGISGGSGGGSRSPGGGAGFGNTPPVTPPQGNPGTANQLAGGGGGAGAAGAPARPGPAPCGSGSDGGVGVPTFIAPASGTTGPAPGRFFAGGGGGGAGGASCQVGASGGAGGGGDGFPVGAPCGGSAGSAGTANTGGGGGGGNDNGNGGAGGSGIVVIRYKFQ